MQTLEKQASTMREEVTQTKKKNDELTKINESFSERLLSESQTS